MSACISVYPKFQVEILRDETKKETQKCREGETAEGKK